MSPTAAWLAAASRPDARPIFVFRMPDLTPPIYFASDPGHYPDDLGGEPHHAGNIAEGGLPTVSRKIQNLFYGRSVVALGSIQLIDDGSWDAYFGAYDSTLRGARLQGFVTYAGLSWSDAENYLNARVDRAQASGGGLTLVLVDEQAYRLSVKRIAAGTYTSQKLGDVVKARLTAAGLAYPADYDTTAWNAWTAAGKPGDYTVTGQWSEGSVFDILDSILSETMTWYSFTRAGKFYIEQFADLGASPSVDVSLEDTNSLFEGGDVVQYTPVFRQQTVKYNGGASSITKTVNLSPSHPWWDTAKEGEPKDLGIDGLTDATSLCAARLALLSSEHLMVRVRADGRMLGYDLGATAQLTLGPKNMPAIDTIYHRVLQIDEDPNQNENKLVLWTKRGGPPLP